MLKFLTSLWTKGDEPPLRALPQGQRVYAIGDIHGRLDLLTALVAGIDEDDRARGAAETTIILLGDLIDRGPDSAGVLAFARALSGRRNVRIICGNHEEMFLRSFADRDAFRDFLQFGGRETILSYAVDPAAFRSAELDEAQAMMAQAVPQADIVFINTFEDAVVIGDYAFVHAGVRPGHALCDQTIRDLRWIREPFLSYAGVHEHLIVHGHTIALEPEIEASRIGIDTGAYRTGRLTALGLEGEQQWLIQADDTDQAIAITVSQP